MTDGVIAMTTGFTLAQRFRAGETVYTAWCGVNSTKPITSTAFGRRMTERGMSSGRGRDGKKIYNGLRLRGADENTNASI